MEDLQQILHRECMGPKWSSPFWDVSISESKGNHFSNSKFYLHISAAVMPGSTGIVLSIMSSVSMATITDKKPLVSDCDSCSNCFNIQTGNRKENRGMTSETYPSVLYWFSFYESEILVVSAEYDLNLELKGIFNDLLRPVKALFNFCFQKFWFYVCLFVPNLHLNHYPKG